MSLSTRVQCGFIFVCAGKSHGLQQGTPVKCTGEARPVARQSTMGASDQGLRR